MGVAHNYFNIYRSVKAAHPLYRVMSLAQCSWLSAIAIIMFSVSLVSVVHEVASQLLAIAIMLLS